jgi:hypothetical protein
VKKVDDNTRIARHGDDDPNSYMRLRAPVRRRPARGDGVGVSGSVGVGMPTAHGCMAHLARHGQAAVVHGGVAHLALRGQAAVTSNRGASRPWPPGGFNARSAHVARRCGECARDG